jgi:hypothetical protein
MLLLQWAEAFQSTELASQQGNPIEWAAATLFQI